MRVQQRPYLAALALAAITACSSHSASAPVPIPASGPANTAPAAGTRAKITVVVPQPVASTTAATSRRPLYVSPSSVNFVVAVNGGSPTTYGLTPQSPGCSIVVTNLTCSFSFIAPAGQDAFAISLTDSGKNVLSRNVVMATLAPGVVTPVGLTLSGIVASVQVVPTQALPGAGVGIEGTAPPFHFPGLFPETVEAEAFDADGNLIIGPGAPTITGMTVDSSLASVRPMPGPDPNAYLLQPVDATAGGKTVNVNATFQGVALADHTTTQPVTGGTAYTFTPALIAVAGQNASVYSIESTNEVGVPFHPCPGMCVRTLSDDIAVDATGQIYILYHHPPSGFPLRVQSVIAVFSPGATLPARNLAASAGIGSASSIAVDSTGRLYVADKSGKVLEFAPGATTPSSTITGTPTNPGKILVDNAGNIFLADIDGGAVNVYPPNSGTPSETLTDASIPNPQTLALDASGGVYVADETNGNITYFPAGQTSATGFLNDTSFVGSPLMIDPSGNLWVSETGATTLERLAASALPNAFIIDLKFMPITGTAGAMGWIP